MVLRKAQTVVRPLGRTFVVHRKLRTRPKLNELDVLRDLILGGRHSRSTVTRFGVSLPTADRWLAALWTKIPNVLRVRDGKTTWYEWERKSAPREPNGIRRRR